MARGHNLQVLEPAAVQLERHNCREGVIESKYRDPEQSFVLEHVCQPWRGQATRPVFVEQLSSGRLDDGSVQRAKAGHHHGAVQPAAGARTEGRLLPALNSLLHAPQASLQGVQHACLARSRGRNHVQTLQRSCSDSALRPRLRRLRILRSPLES